MKTIIEFDTDHSLTTKERIYNLLFQEDWEEDLETIYKTIFNLKWSRESNAAIKAVVSAVDSLSHYPNESSVLLREIKETSTKSALPKESEK